MQYPPDPSRPEEIIVVMRQAGHDRHGLRLRALISVLWRAGLRISEALALNETDIDVTRGSLLIRHGKATSASSAVWTKHRSLPLTNDNPHDLSAGLRTGASAACGAPTAS